MRRKPIIAGAVLLVVLLFLFLLFSLARRPPQDITVRHVGSIQSNNITTMTFEITNNSAASYIFSPFAVRVLNGRDWSHFQAAFEITKPPPLLNLWPNGSASYSFDVTNFPKGSVVRFSIRSQKILVGFEGFLRRAEFNLRSLIADGRLGKIPLNPYDTKSMVAGLLTEVVTEEWVEAGR